MLRSQFAIDHPSKSFSISFISSDSREISTSGSTYIFLSRLLEIKTSHALCRSVFVSSSALFQRFNFSPLVPSRAASVSSNCTNEQIVFTFHASRLTFFVSFLLPTLVSFARLRNCYGGENESVELSYPLYAHELRNWEQPRVSHGNHQQAG